jgi:uncharacterized membrane protein YphA (DoxX/SURF4 family)
MGLKTTTWLERLGRWGLSAIFLFAAVPKILDPAGFAEDVTHYALLPDAAVNVVAVLLPWIEAVGALALLTGFAAEGGLLLANLLLLLFLGALGQAWARGLDIDCGCFGHGKGNASVALAFLRDLLFFLLAGGVLALRGRRLRLAAGR